MDATRAQAAIEHNAGEQVRTMDPHCDLWNFTSLSSEEYMLAIESQESATQRM
jgi:hypothetical protein